MLLINNPIYTFNLKKNIMKKLIIIFLTISFSYINAQNSPFNSKPFYISGNLGVYKSTENNAYRNMGSTRIGGGIGFGFNIVDNIMFYTRAQYISKSDFNGYYDINYLDSELKVVNSIGTANASVSQFIVNTGLQYNVFISADLTLGLLGGITYTLIDQEARSFSGALVQQIDNEWFYGYFGGASAEKHFKNSDFTLFAEVLYNYIDENSLYFREAFSGLNFTVGGRYYMFN